VLAAALEDLECHWSRSFVLPLADLASDSVLIEWLKQRISFDPLDEYSLVVIKPCLDSLL
jgi:hypothetical protein